MIRKLFLYADLFAEPVCFSIKGQTRFRTVWGAIISSFLFILLIIILWSSIQDYKDGVIKKVLFSEIYESNSNYVLDSTQFIYEINMFQPDQYDENFDQQIEITFVAFDGFQDSVLLFNKSKIINEQNIVYYKYTLLPNQTIEIRNNVSLRTNIKLLPLNQQSQGNSTNKKLNQYNFTNQYKVEIKIQSSLINQQNAFETFIQQQYVILTKGLTKIVPIEVRRVKRQEEPQIYQQTPLPTNSFYSNIMSEQVIFNEHSEGIDLLVIQVTLNNILQCYNIEKFGILDIMSGFGGIYQFIFTFILLILRPLNKIMQKYVLITALFDFSDGKNQQQTQSNQKRNAMSNFSFNTMFKSRIDSTRKTNSSRRKSSFYNLKNSIKHACQDSLVGIPQILSSKNSEIQTKIQSYFKKIQNDFALSLTDYIKYRFTCCLKRYNNKRKHIRYAENKIISNMDMYYIIRKLSEIDKLKMLLLSNEQVKLFDYLPKQVIDLEKNFEIKNQQDQIQEEFPNFKSLIDAQQAYKQISKTGEENIISKRLMTIIDPDIIDIFKVSSFQNQESLVKILDQPNEEKQSDRDLNIDLLPDQNSQRQNEAQKVKYFQKNNKQMFSYNQSVVPSLRFTDTSPNMIVRTERNLGGDQITIN